ncbi:MAG TPA: hypothetical protein VES67_11690 [Vicinamibacterales bacterium]|nr:hypothetical protein [Vicinamibacterales bacterium]
MAPWQVDAVHHEIVLCFRSWEVAQGHGRLARTLGAEHPLTELFEQSRPIEIIRDASASREELPAVLSGASTGQIEISDGQDAIHRERPGDVALDGQFADKLVTITTQPVHVELQAEEWRGQSVVSLRDHLEGLGADVEDFRRFLHVVGSMTSCSCLVRNQS